MVVKIQIPQNVAVLVKDGQKVDFKTSLFKKSVKRNIKIPLAKILDIKPGKIFFSLKKVVGEEVHKGEVLAIKKGFWEEKKFYSEYDGILKEINHQDGYLVISGQTEEEESIISFFKGEIKGVEEGLLKVDIKAAKEFSLLASSQDFGGEVYYPKAQDINTFKQEEIDSKVLLMKKIESFNQVRLEVIGALGFITLEPLSQKPSIHYATIKNARDWEEIVKTNLPYVVVSGSSVYFYQ